MFSVTLQPGWGLMVVWTEHMQSFMCIKVFQLYILSYCIHCHDLKIFLELVLVEACWLFSTNSQRCFFETAIMWKKLKAHIYAYLLLISFSMLHCVPAVLTDLQQNSVGFGIRHFQPHPLCPPRQGLPTFGPWTHSTTRRSNTKSPTPCQHAGKGRVFLSALWHLLCSPPSSAPDRL